MLTPEQEADLRVFVERHPYGGDDYTVSTLATAHLLEEIDRLRLEVKRLTLALGAEVCPLCEGGGRLPEDGRDCPRCLEPQIETPLSNFGLGK